MGDTPESQAQPVRADTEEQRSERSYKAAAHNPSNTAEGREHAAEKLAELHEQRTGESLDPKKEAEIGEKKAAQR
ncbi:2934_t:CDS:2 [Funneliformis caledonium]|uniref:2934_t:CDS:1 n=1 Tax=Funneliformis caledonium TaxID=1117310 RepID=A0A9N9ATU2_9GLOM|nr:2934_t:CDS:2 [Funneliformis caledonium]